MSKRNAILRFFDFHRTYVLSCLDENYLDTRHHFLKITGPYYVAFGAIDHLATLRDHLLNNDANRNRNQVKFTDFLEDLSIWSLGGHISIRKLYIDILHQKNIELLAQQTGCQNRMKLWQLFENTLIDLWQIDHHVDTCLVSLQPDCSYSSFIQKLTNHTNFTQNSIKLKNTESYKYSHLIYTLRCDLMHENRPTEQDALFDSDEIKPSYSNRTDENGQRKSDLTFPPRLFYQIIANAIDYLETEYLNSDINPYEVVKYSGLYPQKKKILLI